MKKLLIILLAIFLYLATGLCQINNSIKIRFLFGNDISSSPVSGRLILGFNPDTSKPVNNPDILNPQPTFAWDVKNWKPGDTLVLDRTNAICWNGDLNSLNGWYGVQAALKTNREGRTLKATGNTVTAKKIIYIEKGKTSESLVLTFSIEWRGEKKFKETDLLKEINVRSDILTMFYGKPDSIRAAVILPESYLIDNFRQYPTVYVFGGWESSHFDALYGEPQKRYGMSGFGEDKIFVFVNHECRTGYHEFCNSEVNGPREETFFKELIPYVESEFRVMKNRETRFLMGQSSGAWAGLWLLINYPDEFGGVFAGSPDPIDFTDFLGTNIYEKNANMFFDTNGNIKYLVKGVKDKYPSVTMKDFTGVDLLAGWGEQMYSFDAVFSKKGPDGEPLHLYDWYTGKVNPEVAESWKAHDLNLIVSNFDKHKIKLLQNKIHIYVADNDPFGLNRPVKLFQKILDKKGIEADIRFFSTGGHVIWTDEIRKAMNEVMDKKIEANNK